MPSGSSDEQEALAEAYKRRDAQLYEARGALAEAVATLEAELNRSHEEAGALRAKLDALSSELAGAREHAGNLADEAEKQRRLAVQHAGEVVQLREEVARLAAELQDTQELVGTLREMKAVRWTATPRRLAGRLRGR
jgi:uncharacterized coiled-coil DUF342 family protein